MLIKDEAFSSAEVIDGQQRLTTLTILLAAITSRLSGKVRDNCESYVKEPGNPLLGLAAKPRLSLRERDRNFFARYVQEIQLEELLKLDPQQLDNEAQRNIQANARSLLERLDAAFNRDESMVAAFATSLLVHSFLVVVSTPNPQSAFRVFSVLNSRGLDLLPTDIIKADIIGNIPESEQQATTERWEELEIETGRSGFVELFGHIRMIRVKQKARRTLLEEFRDHVIPLAESPAALMRDVIEPYADAYLDAKNGNYRATELSSEVNGLLGWLNRIDNADWLPPAIAFLAARRADSAYVAWFFRKLERLAAYLHVCSKNINERIDRYSELLVDLEHEHSMGNPIGSVNLTEAEKTEMRSALAGPIYTLTARRRNYVILRLDSFLSDGAATYDPNVLTIEHVLPQSVDPDSEWAARWPNVEEREKWIHSIANLVPLTQRKNSMAWKFDFEKKKSIYFSGRAGVASFALTTQVLSSPDWTPASIVKRQSDLLAVFQSSWDLS